MKIFFRLGDIYHISEIIWRHEIKDKLRYVICSVNDSLESLKARFLELKSIDMVISRNFAESSTLTSEINLENLRGYVKINFRSISIYYSYSTERSVKCELGPVTSSNSLSEIILLISRY